MGMQSGGLNRFISSEGGFEVYTRESGLPNNTVVSIQQDAGGNFWLGTKKGLCKFNPVTKHLRVYTQEDGIQGNEFSQGSLETRNGKFYFGGSNGFTVFHPDSIRDNPLIPPVYITNLQIFNKNVSVGQENSPDSRN